MIYSYSEQQESPKIPCPQDIRLTTTKFYQSCLTPKPASPLAAFETYTMSTHLQPPRSWCNTTIFPCSACFVMVVITNTIKKKIRTAFTSFQVNESFLRRIGPATRTFLMVQARDTANPSNKTHHSSRFVPQLLCSALSCVAASPISASLDASASFHDPSPRHIPTVFLSHILFTVSFFSNITFSDVYIERLFSFMPPFRFRELFHLRSSRTSALFLTEHPSSRTSVLLAVVRDVHAEGKPQSQVRRHVLKGYTGGPFVQYLQAGTGACCVLRLAWRLLVRPKIPTGVNFYFLQSMFDRPYGPWMKCVFGSICIRADAGSQQLDLYKDSGRRVLTSFGRWWGL